MTHLLKKAFAEASKLPKEEQNILAKRLLEEFASERSLKNLHPKEGGRTFFAESQDLLSQLADEAVEEFEHGKTG